MHGGKRSRGDGRVSHAGRCVCVGIGRIAKPGTFLDEAAETFGPLRQKLIDIVAAHLIDNQKHHEFGPRVRILGCRNGRSL